jgi:hypothetical protein
VNKQSQTIDINLSAAVQFGQMVERHWRNTEGTPAVMAEDYIIISESDKQVVRENIMQCLWEQYQRG